MAEHDMAIVGAGPGGLQAALKGALLSKDVALFDKGRRHSRVFFAPRVANVPATAQARRGSSLVTGGYEAIERVNDELGDPVTVHGKTRVTAVEHAGDGFEVAYEADDGRRGSARARVVVLATGVVDRQPWIGPGDYDIGPILPYANKGLAEYCLLCDGHTVVGKEVVVVGIDEAAVGIGRTLRDGFDADVTLAQCIPCALGDPAHTDQEHDGFIQEGRRAGFEVLDIAIDDVEGIREDEIVLVDAGGERYRFDKAFLSFGWYDVNNDLAVELGARPAPSGYLYTDEECRVLEDARGEPIERLYAVGDLRNETWNQIPSAWADAETAVIHAWGQQL